MWKNYNEYLEFCKQRDQRHQAKIKNMKKVIVATSVTIAMLTGVFFGSLGWGKVQKDKEQTNDFFNETTTEQKQEQPKYRSLEQLRKVKLKTHTIKYGGEDWDVVGKQEILQLCREFKYAIQDHYESRGAIYFTNNDTKEFWPKDIEYWVLAMISAESDFRPGVENEIACEGLLGIRKDDMLKSINGWANNTAIWGDDIPYVNCNASELDMKNSVTAIEYTYHYMAYHLANVLKKDTTFKYNGQEHCIWDYTKFTPTRQVKLLVATHFWGYGTLTKSALGIHEKGYTLSDIENSDYVKRVIARYNMLKPKLQEQALAR